MEGAFQENKSLIYGTLARREYWHHILQLAIRVDNSLDLLDSCLGRKIEHLERERERSQGTFTKQPVPSAVLAKMHQHLGGQADTVEDSRDPAFCQSHKRVGCHGRGAKKQEGKLWVNKGASGGELEIVSWSSISAAERPLTRNWENWHAHQERASGRAICHREGPEVLSVWTKAATTADGVNLNGSRLNEQRYPCPPSPHSQTPQRACHLHEGVKRLPPEMGRREE